MTADRAFNGYGTNFENSPEPIYGTQFLPRKFKVGVTIPGDNSVDLFTQDLGVIVIMNDKGGPARGGHRGAGDPGMVASKQGNGCRDSVQPSLTPRAPYHAGRTSVIGSGTATWQDLLN